MTSRDEFEEIRTTLAAADSALVEALDRRARAIREYVALRERDPELYLSLPRDAEVVERAIQARKEFPADALEPVLREVLSASAAMVAPVKVVFLGVEGGFAHDAARRRFGSHAELSGVGTVLGVLDEVQRGRVSFGVVPLETSSDGALTATLHGLVETDVRICGELTLPVSYHLLSKTGNVGDIDKIYAAPAAIAACEIHLRASFPRATLLDVPSGEVAAELARDDHGAAAVGNDLVAERHSLRIVRERVEDEAGIETRFAIVGNDHPPRTGADRTVLALAVHDEPGALYNALKPFADRSINLTRLESRPARSSAWRYLFFVEMDGHVTDRPLLTAVEELRSSVRFVKILGSYPRP
jgi:chorismate mutase/prephenate dehydratase